MSSTNNTITSVSRYTNVKVPVDLWNRAKVAIAKAGVQGERLNMKQVLNEGLELRVSQIEKKLAKAGAA